ncbi:hypothetical protein D9M72_642270 [compost metagenome]
MQCVEIEADEPGGVFAVMGLQPFGGGGKGGAEAIAFLDEMTAPERGDRKDDLAALGERGRRLVLPCRCHCHAFSLAKQAARARGHAVAPASLVSMGN